MARMVKDCPRNDYFQDNTETGELFMDYKGVLFDSNDVHVIHHGLDTVRQLYSGLLSKTYLDEIEHVYNKGFGLTQTIRGYQFIVSSGGRSGYRYTLKNKNLGLVLLVGSKYSDMKYNAHHLKIQCSPSFLLSRTLDEIQRDMDLFANELMYQLLHTGCAVHICADVQGWTMPDDLDYKLTTKAHKVYKASGASQVEYQFADVSINYGRGETYTFGSASSLQFSAYLKSKAIKDKNEADIWLPVYEKDGDFKPDMPIHRFEVRFHQTVLNQFANGSGFQVNKLTDIDGHFDGLWKYALNNFRLDDSKTYINPFWQWLRDDLSFNHKRKFSIDYKREYKSPLEQGDPSDRCVAICFGQLCSIYARNGYNVKKAFKFFLNSGFWVNLWNLYSNKGYESYEINEVIEEAIACKFARLQVAV